MDVWVLFSHDGTEAEEVEACATVHGAFIQLQSMNVLFDWAVAPRMLKCGRDRCLVAPEVNRARYSSMAAHRSDLLARYVYERRNRPM